MHDMQTAAFDQLEASALDAEAAWEAKLAAGNAIIADANDAAGKKVHESVRKSAAKL